jgi:hypothetical protein
MNTENNTVIMTKEGDKKLENFIELDNQIIESEEQK